VGGGQRAEVAREPLLVVVIQADTAEDEGLMLVQRRADRGDGLRVETEVGAEAGDLGADAGGDLADGQLRARWGVVMTGPSLLVTVGSGRVRRLNDRLRCTPA
jgi:hypothetical protein